MPISTGTKKSGSGRITLDDVAKDAGVSRSTASLVVRGSPLIPQETSQRVRASMARLGYVYDRLAANLRTHRSNSVGLIFTQITNPYFAELTVGIQSRLDEVGFSFFLSSTSDDLVRYERVLSTMLEHRVDGLIICGVSDTSTPLMEQQLSKRQVPVVLVDRYLPGYETDFVGCNIAAGFESCVDHLVAHGHKKIALLGGPAHSNSWRERVQGYTSGCTRHGLPVNDAWLINTPATREGGYDAVRQLLAQPYPPTAAVCYNDVIAMGVTIGLDSLALEAGRDFAVIGCNDLEDTKFWRPPLTTISMSPKRIGWEAANLLLERIADPDGPRRHIRLPCELVVRDSCGPHTLS